MVYPVLKINQDDYEIELVDTQGDLELILEATDTPELFYSLMEIFLDQYNSGYSSGYVDGIDDCLDDLDEHWRE